MATHQKIAMVILAAGASSRMKAIKQLLPWKNTTLLGNTIEQGLASKVDTIFVILGANKDKIAPQISNYEIQIIENRNWNLGMGSSISTAIQFITNSPTHFYAVLITLADQPLLDATFYNKLINKFLTNDKSIIATKRLEKGSVPAIFSAKHFKILLALNQDIGAKKIMKKHQENVLLFDAQDAAIDVDTIEAYTTLYEKYGS